MNFAAFLPRVKEERVDHGAVVDDQAQDSRFTTNFLETVAAQRAVYILLVLVAQLWS